MYSADIMMSYMFHFHLYNKNTFFYSYLFCLREIKKELFSRHENKNKRTAKNDIRKYESQVLKEYLFIFFTLFTFFLTG